MLRESIGHPCGVLQLIMHPQAPRIMFGHLSGQSTLSIRLISRNHLETEAYFPWTEGGVRVFSMRYLQKIFAASRRKVIPNQWIKTLCGAVRRPTKKCTFFLPSRTDFLHFKSDWTSKMMYVLFKKVHISPKISACGGQIPYRKPLKTSVP